MPLVTGKRVPRVKTQDGRSEACGGMEPSGMSPPMGRQKCWCRRHLPPRPASAFFPTHRAERGVWLPVCVSSEEEAEGTVSKASAWSLNPFG